MFLKGGFQDKDMDNTSDKYVLPWLEAVKEISPRQVMIYTIDRETPDHDLQKATHEELDRIAALVKEAGKRFLLIKLIGFMPYKKQLRGISFADVPLMNFVE